MSTVTLEAETRTDLGKGASRRLRRLEKKIPGVLYGGDKKPEAIHLLHKEVVKALETESIFSSVFDLKVNGKTEHVILKDLQRHPYKPMIMHMDLQRVSAKDILVKMIPLHFIHEEEAKGVKAGGMISHTLTQVEVRCQAKYLPEFIEVDMLEIDLNEVIHLSQLKLPKNVHLAADVSDPDHDHQVASIHVPKAAPVEEEVPVASETLSETESDESASEDSSGEEETK